MMNTIGAILKYSALVLTVLVLSHIIQIKGTTISQHVENGMNWVSGGSRHAGTSMTRVTQQFSSAVHNATSRTTDNNNKDTPDEDGITRNDQKELTNVIRNSHRR